MKFSTFFNRVKEKFITPTRRTVGYSAGTRVDEDTSMQSSAFYRGIIYISTQIAKLPFEVKDSNNKIIDNDVSYLLNIQPNPEMTAFNFKCFMIQTAIVLGNSYAEIERDLLGRPKALWPINPRRVYPVRDAQGVLWYHVLGGSDSGSDVYLDPKDVYIVRNFHTKDGFQGQGVVGYAMDTLGINLGADKFANSLYANGGMPSGTLTYPGKLSDEAFLRLKETWASDNGGRKTGQTAILEDGMTFNPVSWGPDVLQFLESRKFNISEMSRFLGVPPTKLFDPHAAKYNNIEHANLEVATDTLDSWCKNLELEADIKLLGKRYKGYRTMLDLYAVFRGDMSTRSAYFNIMMQSGAITPNEIRRQEGLEPYSGGDRYYIASNNFTPEDRQDEIIDARVAPKQIAAPTPSTEAPPKNADVQNSDEIARAARKKILEILEKRH
jgi:HK97 family phage portal protein